MLCGSLAELRHSSNSTVQQQRASRRIQARCWAVLMPIVLLFTQAVYGQQTPLQLYKNYFVTGDYVVGGWHFGGTFTSTPTGAQYAQGTINIPDAAQPLQTGVPTTVPDGATIVAAFLYWQEVEVSGSGPFLGQSAFFNGYAINGTQLGNTQGPSSWSSGGCAGANSGSKTLRTYRADVRPYLLNGHVDQSGKVQYNGSYTAMFADSGKNQLPYVLGATLVVVYRVFSPAVPLNSIVIYDGAYYPNNTQLNMIQSLPGFYQAASPDANHPDKLTHIVGNGQINKYETVSLQASGPQGSGANVTLPPLYSQYPHDPFPGIYISSNGTWDNPTWIVNGAMQANAFSATASVIPDTSGTFGGAGCPTWGATILSSTVQDSDGDGLLDAWEDNQGYTDVRTGQWVALPGAYKFQKDIFVEVDWLQNLDGNAGPYLHSHLPKKEALDEVGNVFKNAPVAAAPGCQAPHTCSGINVHFDLGPNIYQGDPFVVGYPVAIPAGATVPANTGGNSIAESETVCSDSAPAKLCAFPGFTTQRQNNAALSWKGQYLFLKNNATDPTTNATLGNFELGRKDSYHYVLFGHGLGMPRSVWSAGAVLSSSTSLAKLVSVANAGSTATVTIQTPSTGIYKPGDCPSAAILACNDANADRVTIAGALGQTALNGTYYFTNVSSTTGSNNVTTTRFTITTSNVADGAYSFSNEPQLTLSYLGPKSSSGQSDTGGADTAITFGLWPADNPPNCHADPSLGPPYCDDQVGGVQAQAGTLMHEIGHTLTLAHGGTYYSTPQNNPPTVPFYGVNCKPNYVSGMSYLFQIHGFLDGTIGYSPQLFAPLDETSLDETSGIGLDPGAVPSAHPTRWYGPANPTSGSPATQHCDGSPLARDSAGNITETPLVRVECVAPSCTTNNSQPIDWNNDLSIDTVAAPGVDINFSGSIVAGPFLGFDDWGNTQQVQSGSTAYYTIGLDLRQIGTRQSSFGFSSSGASDGSFGGGGATDGSFGGGGATDGSFGGGGASDGSFGGGGATDGSFGGGGATDGSFGGGGATDGSFGGGGVELDFQTANSTVDAPTLQSALWDKPLKTVDLAWTLGFGQVRYIYVYRMTGAFTVPNPSQATLIAKLATVCNSDGSCVAPTSYSDGTVKANTTYTYFLVDQIVPDPGSQTGRTSGPSNVRTVTTH